MKSICVYCGSALGAQPVYRETAVRVGQTIARRGKRLVYGGGAVGLMGALADAALAAGGQVLGIIPRMLFEREIQHGGLTEMRVVESMHVRKADMIEAADAMIALPGGFGTYEEIFEAMTWAQLGHHSKPCGLLNVNGFYDGFIALVERAISDGFVHPEHRGVLLIDDDIERLLDRLETHQVPRLIKWREE